MKEIAQGDEFEIKDQDGTVNKFRRESNDPEPMFESTRIRVTHLFCSMEPKIAARPYTFGTEPEWFVQRGLKAI